MVTWFWLYLLYFTGFASANRGKNRLLWAILWSYDPIGGKFHLMTHRGESWTTKRLEKIGTLSKSNVDGLDATDGNRKSNVSLFLRILVYWRHRVKPLTSREEIWYSWQKRSIKRHPTSGVDFGSRFESETYWLVESPISFATSLFPIHEPEYFILVSMVFIIFHANQIPIEISLKHFLLESQGRIVKIRSSLNCFLFLVVCFVGKLLQPSFRSPFRSYKQTRLEERGTFRRGLSATTSAKVGRNKIAFHCGR